MQYAQGSINRVFYIRFEHDEDLIASLYAFVTDKTIRSGVVHLIGAVSSGTLACGPKRTALPPDPSMQELEDGHELLGTGFIRTGEKGPVIHLHVAAGRDRQAVCGCLRRSAGIYLLIEAVIIEFSDFSIDEAYDSKAEMNLPVPSPSLPSTHTDSALPVLEPESDRLQISP